jgi:hypothetical protein
MNAARLALLALVCALPLVATAQWQWVDKSGRKVFSDKAPPPEVAPEQILKRPKGVAAPAPAAAPAAAPSPLAANLPKPSGKDKVLEEKKKQADAEAAAKKKAEEEKVASMRADNCSRAKNAKATYDSGVRLSRTNDKGEREILDDEARAKEVKHLNEVIARDCAKAQ